MKLLLTGAYQYSNSQIHELESLGYEVIFIQDERDQLEVSVKDIEIVVCNALFVNNNISEFSNLKYIQLTSSGYDRVPMDYINENDIEIRNANGVYSTPMAEWVLLKILEIYKKSKEFYKLQEVKKWSKQRDVMELSGKNAAIIGVGNLGLEIAKRLKAFNVNVIGVGRQKKKSQLIDEYLDINNLDEVLEKSDIVILSLPLNKETYHLINASRLKKMKKNSILINVARGNIVDEAALVNFMLKKKFLGVAMDVFEQEPLPECNPIWTLDRTIVTPHNSFISENVSGRLFNLMFNNLREWSKKGV